MSQVSNSNKITPNPNYFARVDLDGNPKLLRCSPQGGYPTAAAAIEAEIKEIQEQMRFHLDTISGLLNDIEDAKEQQGHAHLYCEINALLNEIEKPERRRKR
jgi:hypothetical protein